MRDKMLHCELKEIMDREQPWLTQKKLAQDLNISLTPISLLYNNDFKRLNLEVIQKLCDYFDVSIDELIVLKSKK